MKELQKVLDALKKVEGNIEEITVPEEAPYAEGRLEAPLCLIGEAPGEEEELASRPFVGDAGKATNRLLHSAGLSRSDCRIENVFQFRPYKNDISPYIKFISKKGVKTSPTYDASVVHLKERLEQTKAKVFVPLGNVALHALTGKWGITKWRGSILPCSLVPGRKVIPTIHPAAAGRQHIYSYFIAYDLLRIASQMQTSDIALMDRRLQLAPSFAELMNYIDLCATKDTIAMDIEVTNEEVSHVSLAIAPDDAICIPFYDNGKDYFTAEQEMQVWRALDKLLSNVKVIKAGHNLDFDATFLHEKYGICIRPIEDTMVAMRTAFPDFPMSLAFAVSIYCEGEPYYKDTGKKWIKNPYRSHLEFRRYSAMDSAVVMEILPKVIHDLRRMGNFETYIHQVALVEPLIYMQEHGILMNVERMKELRLEAEDKIRKLQVELDTQVGHPINPNSSKQVGEYFYDELKIKPYYKKNTTGEKVITTDVTALQRLMGKGYKAAATILDIRHQKHLVSTYYTVKIDIDNRLRCSYNPVGTPTGRISSSESIFGMGTNLLNQPPEMKQLMIPDPGYIMVNIDLSQAELIVVAYLWNVTKMIAALERGEDLHCLTASLIFNKPANEISDEKGSTDIGFGRYSERDIGKRSNHGFDYGLGSDTFAVTNQVPQEDAKRIQAVYHMIYPEIHQGHRAIQETLRTKGALINMLGRKRFFKDQWGHKLFNKAYNFNAQSTVADKLNRDGFCALYYARDIDSSYIELLNQIYDSILFQYPLNQGASALTRVLDKVCRRLEQSLSWKGRKFSIPVDVSIGWNAKDMTKFKSKDVYDTERFVKRLEEEFYDS